MNEKYTYGDVKMMKYPEPGTNTRTHLKTAVRLLAPQNQGMM